MVASLVDPAGGVRSHAHRRRCGCRGRGDRVVGRAYDVVVHGVPVLAVVELLAHHVLEIAAPEVQDLPEGFAEVAVQGCVNDRVQETVAVAKPEEYAREGTGYGFVIAQEQLERGQYEEGQPAYGERAHDYAQGRAGLALLGQLEPQTLLLVGRVDLAAGAVGGLASPAVRLAGRRAAPGRLVRRRWYHRGRHRGRYQDRLLFHARLQHRTLGLVALAWTTREALDRVHAAL